jgi:hypothetical protein
VDSDLKEEDVDDALYGMGSDMGPAVSRMPGERRPLYVGHISKGVLVCGGVGAAVFGAITLVLRGIFEVFRKDQNVKGQRATAPTFNGKALTQGQASESPGLISLPVTFVTDDSSVPLTPSIPLTPCAFLEAETARFDRLHDADAVPAMLRAILCFGDLGK